MLGQPDNSSEQKTEPEYFLTEADTATQSVDESEGVDDQLGPGDLHCLVVDDEHVHPLGLHVGAHVVRLIGEAGAGERTLAGLGGVETGVELEQEVEHRGPLLGAQGEGAALNNNISPAKVYFSHLGWVICEPQRDAANNPGQFGLDLRLQT